MDEEGVTRLHQTDESTQEFLRSGTETYRSTAKKRHRLVYIRNAQQRTAETACSGTRVRL